MGNHFHLVLQPPHLGLSEGMQILNAGYAVRTNRRYKRTGHLVQNRFYSHEVESEEHLLELCRYVVLNQPGSRRSLRITGRLAVEQLSGDSRV